MPERMMEKAIKDKVMVEPLTNYTVTRIQKDYNHGTTMLGGMFTSTNRYIQDTHLDFLSRECLYRRT